MRGFLIVLAAILWSALPIAGAAGTDCFRRCEESHLECTSRVLTSFEYQPDAQACQQAYLDCTDRAQATDEGVAVCLEQQMACERAKLEELEQERAAELSRCDQGLTSCSNLCRAEPPAPIQPAGPGPPVEARGEEASPGR